MHGVTTIKKKPNNMDRVISTEALNELDLTHFKQMFHFYTPWKHKKTGSFLIFSWGIDVEHCLKMR